MSMSYIYSSADQRIPLFATEVRRVRKNDYVSFVEPLTSGTDPGPRSSIYNLKRIKTVYNIKAYTYWGCVNVDDFSEQEWTSGHVGVDDTLDTLMLSGDPVYFEWHGVQIEGYIQNYNVIEDHTRIYANESGTLTECVLVEIMFERGEAL